MSSETDILTSVASRNDPARVEWQHIPRMRAYELVIRQIEDQILAGALHVGDQLPAERDLAAKLGVSRAAVREAMRAMEAQGVVRSGVGVGPDSGTFLTSMPSKALTQFLRLHMALANFPIDDVLEARIMLERWSARLAARQASADDLTAMARLLDAMDAETDDMQAFNELDTDFHVAMAEAAHNTLITEMTTAIGTRCARWCWPRSAITATGRGCRASCGPSTGPSTTPSWRATSSGPRTPSKSTSANASWAGAPRAEPGARPSLSPAPSASPLRSTRGESRGRC